MKKCLFHATIIKVLKRIFHISLFSICAVTYMPGRKLGSSLITLANTSSERLVSSTSCPIEISLASKVLVPIPFTLNQTFAPRRISFRSFSYVVSRRSVSCLFIISHRMSPSLRYLPTFTLTLPMYPFTGAFISRAGVMPFFNSDWVEIPNNDNW